MRVASPGAGEDDVLRLVADQSSVRTTRGGEAATSTDADAVGEVVHHPHLAVIARRDGHRLQADRDGAQVRARPSGVTSKISNWSSGVFTANRRRPSGRAPADAPARSRK